MQNAESYIRSQHLFLEEEIIFKTMETENLIRRLQKLKNELRTAMNFIDWTHISSKFTESNINPIQDGRFRGCSRMEEGAFWTPSLKSAAHILQ